MVGRGAPREKDIIIQVAGIINMEVFIVPFIYKKYRNRTTDFFNTRYSQ